MAYNAVPTVASGDSWTASQHNTYIKDNFSAVWVGTTAGDIDYYTSSTAKNRVAIGTLGNILRSTGSAPAWLANPAANSVLSNTSGGSLAWMANTAIPGRLHTIGTVNFSPGGQVFNSATWADITGATLNLTLTETCTVVVLSVVVGVQTTGGRSFYYRASVDGNVDAAPTQMFNGGESRNEALPNIFIKTGVTAGTKTVKLQCQADSGANNQVERGRFIAAAFVE